MRLDILSKAAFAFPLSSVDESGDAVTDVDVVDARSDFFDLSCKVAAEPAARRSEKVAVLPVGRVQRDGRGLQPLVSGYCRERAPLQKVDAP